MADELPFPEENKRLLENINRGVVELGRRMTSEIDELYPFCRDISRLRSTLYHNNNLGNHETSEKEQAKIIQGSPELQFAASILAADTDAATTALSRLDTLEPLARTLRFIPSVRINSLRSNQDENAKMEASTRFTHLSAEFDRGLKIAQTAWQGDTLQEKTIQEILGAFAAIKGRLSQQIPDVAEFKSELTPEGKKGLADDLIIEGWTKSQQKGRG